MKREAGFSTVEVLLAATIFAFMVTAMLGAYVYGRSAVATGGDTYRAAQLAEEGIDAARNIRDAAFTNMVDGTYGAVQSGNVWTLSGASDTAGIYTRKVTVASNGALRDNITSTTNWTNGSRTPSVTVSSLVTNWRKALPWSVPVLSGSNNVTGTIDGTKIATAGNYAYMVRSGGTPNFLVFNISTPSAPTLAASLTLTGTAYNVAVSGNYAYVASGNDNGELTIVNVTTPTNPSVAALFNAAGTSDGQGIFVRGTVAYLARAANAANNEFLAINVATPTAPARLGYYNLNVAMYQVYVSANYVYISTGSDTQEVIRIPLATANTAAQITTVAALNLTGTTDAITIGGNNDDVYVGQGTTFWTVDGDATTMATLGSVTAAGTINDIASNTGYTHAYIGTTGTAAEFQVVSIATLTAPTIAASVDIAGTASTLFGVSYNPTLDVVVGASASDNQELVVFTPTV